MSRRRDLEHHRQSIGEMREIMNSMKSLAYMETRKLSRFLPAQQAVVESTEQMAADFLSAYPDMLGRGAVDSPVYLLIGTERGFCGDINHALVDKLSTISRAPSEIRPKLLAIGHKLHTLLENDARMIAFIEGASVAEDVDNVLQQVVNELALLHADDANLVLNALYPGEDAISLKRLLPPFQDQRHDAPLYAHAPLLYLTAEEFLLDLTDHHVFSVLHQLLYASLLQENRRRMVHLEGAVRFLDNASEALKQQVNALRQEEIIEEIEVILLSATGLADESRSPRTRRM